MTLKQGQGHQTWYELVDPNEVIIMQSLKNLVKTVSAKKLPIKFLSNQETCHLSPLNMWEVKNSGVFMTCLL